MANLTRRKSGAYVVRYYDDMGSRSLFLGQMQKRSAEEILRHAERLIESRRANVSMPPETAAWVGGVADGLRTKLERLGLIRSGLGSRRMTLTDFAAAYIQQKTHEYSPTTIRNLTQTKKKLDAFFGTSREISSITAEDVEAFRVHLVAVGGLGPNTVSTHCRKAKEFFAAAVARGHVAVNPFAGMKDMQETPNEARQRFMTPEQATRVLNACPTVEWEVIFSLARFGGMRPIEIVGLEWEDIRWKENLIRVRGAKGRRRRVRMRSLPLFPELSAALRRLQASRPAPRGRVVLGYSSESNLGVPMSRIIADAGITDFGRPFLNLRSTRSTELAEKGIPIQDFCRWLGHTPKVALEFYMQVRSASYDRAAASIVTVDPSTLRSA